MKDCWIRIHLGLIQVKFAAIVVDNTSKASLVWLERLSFQRTELNWAPVGANSS